jgi:hypothetical protein
LSDTPDLAFLARQMERMLTETGSFRDEMRVQTASIARLDAIVARSDRTHELMLTETRVIGDQITRIDDRVR